MLMKRTSAVLMLAFGCVMANAEVIYNSIPDTLAPNYPSLGYQATSTAEFGDKITFGGSSRQLSSATFTMSSWAKKSEWPVIGDSTGFDHEVTLNIYSAGDNGAVGSLLGSVTQTFHMLWRPEATTPGQSGWLAPDGTYYNGMAFNIKFDLDQLGLTVPDTIIYGIAYNTQSYGVDPIGFDGPYCSLNYACQGIDPTVGTDVNSDSVYWKTSHAGFYTDKGAGGVGTFREDTGWTGLRPMARFETLGEQAVPGPAAVIPFAVGLLAAAKRRRK